MTYFVILDLHFSSLDLKGNSDCEVKRPTFSFNFRVFTSASDEPCRNYRPFYTQSLQDVIFVPLMCVGSQPGFAEEGWQCACVMGAHRRKQELLS